MHQHVLRLADTKSAIRRLILDSRIPPPIEMNHVRRRCQIQAETACLQGKDEEWDSLVLLKPAHQFLSLADFSLSMQNKSIVPKHRCEKRGQRCCDFPKLR